MRKWFKGGYWLSIYKLFSFKEKLAVFILFLVVIFAGIIWGRGAYVLLTKSVPAVGGHYIEGVGSEPIYINPILSQTRGADSDLAQLVFNGLFEYNGVGELVPDLAENFEVSDDKKTYIVNLRKDVQWHDGNILTAADVVFTIKTLQNPLTKSPLRSNWNDVAVEQIDDYTVKFILSKPYFAFLNNLTVGILPKHIWQNIEPEKILLAEYNLAPIGTGPYKVVNLQKNSNGDVLSIETAAFVEYFKKQPYISKITFNFYPNEDLLIEAYNKKEVMGISQISSNNLDKIKNKETVQFIESITPRYFAAFFNQKKSVPLAYDEVRIALVCAVNRGEIISETFLGKASEMDSPFFSFMNEYFNESECKNDINKAKSILDEKGWKLNDEGIREKDGVKIEFDLVVVDWSDLVKTADLLTRQWAEIGAKVNVKVKSHTDILEDIKVREYDALLYGQTLSLIPDPLPYWHSSEKRDPGKNFSVFDDLTADKLLEEAHEEIDLEKRIEKYREFQKIMTQKNPAVFLYNPFYIYPISAHIKGAQFTRLQNPSGRFNDVENWHIKIKRISKNK